MQYRWSFKKMQSQRWALVRVEEGEHRRVIEAPGYESSDPSDIIQAMMYLNTGYIGERLKEKHLLLLDQIQRECISK